MPVDTTRAQRRNLRFEAIADLLAELDQLYQAHGEGRLRNAGNWTFGQAVGHLATWAEYSFTGAPLKMPWFVRLAMRPFKRRFLYGRMKAGVRIPKVPAGTLGIDDMPADKAVERYRAALDRLTREAPAASNVIFGPLTHEQWIALNLRHAELHLSFFSAT